MKTKFLPALDPTAFAATKSALHVYSNILGGYLKSCRPQRKHWWHASLRPSLNGLATGPVNAGIDFELELDLRNGVVLARTRDGECMNEPMVGQSPIDLAEKTRDFLSHAGLEQSLIPSIEGYESGVFSEYSATQAQHIAQAISKVSTAMRIFQAGIREESSPVQLWPHHFDLSLLWLPGGKISGEDPENEEASDKQMNFGFSLGDASIPEPYFYITAYPLSEMLSSLQMPHEAVWHSDGFNGAVLLYRSLLKKADAMDYLVKLWDNFLSAGRAYLI